MKAGEVSEEVKDGPLISPPSLRIVSDHNKWKISLEVFPEAVTRGVLCKKMFLKISQNWQESTCVRVSFLIKLQAHAEVWFQ